MTKQYFKWMSFCWATLVVLSISQLVSAQVRVEGNAPDLPLAKVDAIYETAFRVVAQEFHLPDGSRDRVPVTLVLGDRDEGVTGDEVQKIYTIYMQRWDEVRFALATSRIAVQHLVSDERKNRMVEDILRRANRIAPVSAHLMR
ncbi:MAG: hypothetical protein HY010_19810 [Acidobacteria bacterium]|nr:hypothetical protein [Acidobacteriota bacterium]